MDFLSPFDISIIRIFIKYFDNLINKNNNDKVIIM